MEYGDKVRVYMNYNGDKDWYKAIYISTNEDNVTEVFMQFPDGFKTNANVHRPDCISEGWDKPTKSFS